MMQSSRPRRTLSAMVIGLLALAGGVFLNGNASLHAEPPAKDNFEPEVDLVLSSANRLIQDVESALSLTTPAEQEELTAIKDYLDLLFKGLDLKKLMRMGFITGEGPVRYRVAVPIENARNFWQQNLIPNGINTRQLTGSLFATTGTHEGFLRLRNGYGIFGVKRSDLPLLAPPPDGPEAQALLKLTDDAAMKLVNKSDEKSVDQRRKSYHHPTLGLRHELQEQIKKTRSESENAFEIRQLASEHQLDHLERFYVDAQSATLLAHHDIDDKSLALDLRYRPIPGTPLWNHVEMLNKEPLNFANVPKAARSNLSLRMRMPLDDMHQRHFTETLDLFRKISHQELSDSKTKTDEQRKATAEIIDLSYKLLLDTVKAGLADGFLESHPNPDGSNTTIAAFQTVDGTAPLAILKLLEKTRADQKVRLKIDSANGVDIHSCLISAEQHPGYGKFFGGQEMYVGTSPKTIWLGAGPNAIDELKASISQVAKPNKGKAADPFLTVSGRVAPWMEFHQANYPEAGSNMFRRSRQMVIDAGEPGDDQFDLWINRDKEEVVGKWTGEPGWTRFVGKFLSDFSKRNLNGAEGNNKPANGN